MTTYRIEASRGKEALDREVYLGDYRGSYPSEADAHAAIAELEQDRPEGHEDVAYHVLPVRCDRG